VDPRQILRNYIDTHETRKAAAEALDCAQVTLYKVLSGARGVGKGMAKRWDRRTRGKLKYSDMVKIFASKSEGDQAKRKVRARGRK